LHCRRPEAMNARLLLIRESNRQEVKPYFQRSWLERIAAAEIAKNIFANFGSSILSELSVSNANVKTNKRMAMSMVINEIGMGERKTRPKFRRTGQIT